MMIFKALILHLESVVLAVVKSNQGELHYMNKVKRPVVGRIALMGKAFFKAYNSTEDKKWLN